MTLSCNNQILSKSFFELDTLYIARNLLGKKLVRKIDNKLISGMIVETEAYIGMDDTACHACKGKTKRTEIMFKEAGCAYIYLIYGMYYMLNIVTERKDFPAAVLIRALEPLEGFDVIEKRKHPTNGPGKLCKSMLIDKSLNGIRVYEGQHLWLENFKKTTQKDVDTGKRIGISYASIDDQNKKWRFWIKNNSSVSTFKKSSSV